MAALTTHRGRGWWLALANAAILVAVFVILAITPAPVTFPGDHWEAILLLAGGLLLLAGNALAAALGAAAAVDRSRHVADENDTMQRLRHYEHFIVYDADGILGTVDEMLPDPSGEPLGFVVAAGWFGGRRFFVLLNAVGDVDIAAREITLRPPRTRPMPSSPQG